MLGCGVEDQLHPRLRLLLGGGLRLVEDLVVLGQLEGADKVLPVVPVGLLRAAVRPLVHSLLQELAQLHGLWTHIACLRSTCNGLDDRLLARGQLLALPQGLHNWLQDLQLAPHDLVGPRGANVRGVPRALELRDDLLALANELKSFAQLLRRVVAVHDREVQQGQLFARVVSDNVRRHPLRTPLATSPHVRGQVRSAAHIWIARMAHVEKRIENGLPAIAAGWQVCWNWRRTPRRHGRLRNVRHLTLGLLGKRHSPRQRVQPVRLRL
mmetsp:Transcript_107173/g.320519  ORF Transcript_107173/g.320519 Transcript_107173/m.320519 type:complete len:268 (-) Transcript_107173:135-938(-)